MLWLCYDDSPTIMSNDTTDCFCCDCASHMRHQLDMMTRTLALLDQRMSLTEDRVAKMTAYARGLSAVPTTTVVANSTAVAGQEIRRTKPTPNMPMMQPTTTGEAPPRPAAVPPPAFIASQQVSQKEPVQNAVGEDAEAASEGGSEGYGDDDFEDGGVEEAQISEIAAKEREIHLMNFEALGLRFRKGHGDSIKFIFSNVIQDDPSRECYFVIHVDDNDVYQLLGVEPPIPQNIRDRLLQTLNEENNISRFTVMMRKQFQQSGV